MKASAHGIVVEEEATTVAVKMVKRTADHTFIKALASELKIMVHLGKHVNVVNLLGACTKNVTKRKKTQNILFSTYLTLFLLRYNAYLINYYSQYLKPIIHFCSQLNVNIHIL